MNQSPSPIEVVLSPVLTDLMQTYGLSQDELLQPATPGSAAIDLRICITDLGQVDPGEVLFVDSGLRMHIKAPNLAGLILPRSGLGSKKGLVLANTVGLIDSDYQGPIKIPLFNRGTRPVRITPLMRVAQLLSLIHI